MAKGNRHAAIDTHPVLRIHDVEPPRAALDTAMGDLGGRMVVRMPRKMVYVQRSVSMC